MGQKFQSISLFIELAKPCTITNVGNSKRVIIFRWVVLALK